MKNQTVLPLRTAACVFIPSGPDTFVAVSRRNDDTQWGIPGGKVDPGESCVASAARECFEEVGLYLKPSMLIPVYAGFCPGPGPQDSFWVTSFVYVGELPTPLKLKLELGLSARDATAADLTDPAQCPFADYNTRALAALRVMQGQPAA